MFEKKDRIMPKIDEFSAEKKATLAEYQRKMAEIKASGSILPDKSGKGPAVDGSAYKGGEYA